MISKVYSVYLNEYKTKSDNKIATNKFRHFLESKFFGINRRFALVYPNHDSNVKRFNVQKDYLLKSKTSNFNVSINLMILLCPIH